MTVRMMHRSLAFCAVTLLASCTMNSDGVNRVGSSSSKLLSPSSLKTRSAIISEAMCGNTACFDISSDGANIGQIFVDAICAQLSPGDFAITVDGEPVTKLHIEDSPCPEIPSDVFFSLTGNQSVAHVCVSVLGGVSGVRVGAKAGNECIIPALPEDCTCTDSHAISR